MGIIFELGLLVLHVVIRKKARKRVEEERGVNYMIIGFHTGRKFTGVLFV